MKAFSLVKLAVQSFSKHGVRGTVKLIMDRLLLRLPPSSPLEHMDKRKLFGTDFSGVRLEEWKKYEENSKRQMDIEAGSTYPLTFEYQQYTMRYALIPAAQQSRGLVVYFHGHNAPKHPAPKDSWQHFDVLAPWDNFGWKDQGSWFWGVQGQYFVAEVTAALIQQIQGKYQHWFCFGESAGGFAATYHGIKSQAHGIYAIAPQINLRAKALEVGLERKENAYVHLMGETLESIPDVAELAAAQAALPPLFLVQNQYDMVNRFSEHGFRLIDIYNQKIGWYGLRVYPAIGHSTDGNITEAEVFFNLLIDKRPNPTAQLPAKKP